MLRWEIVLALALAAPASAHESHDGMQYDPECCHNQDCAEAIEAHPDPADPFVLVVTTWMGTTRIPASMKRRESSDGKLHACMYPNGAPICIYVPPSQ
jgi:hypothetical protein